MKKGKSMVEHMRERNAMQNGPGNPKKYTAGDSISHTQLEKKIDKGISENKILSKSEPNTQKELKRLDVIDNQIKSLRKNPFHETYAKRKYGSSNKKK